MPVKFYTAKDSEGREWGPDHAHEMEPVIAILRKLWRTYHHLTGLYCIFANVKSPKADVLVFTERGLGILELKHYPGNIYLARDGKWMAGPTEIKGGSHGTPHQQVQSYGRTLRQKWLPLILSTSLKRMPEQWDTRIKFQTAVCFTNSDAKLSDIQRSVCIPGKMRLEPWESDFKVLTPADIPNWVATLRFGIDLGRNRGYEPLRLTPELLTKGIELTLDATPWTEILGLMPTPEPYGYLSLNHGGERQVFKLIEDNVVIGRDVASSIVVPTQFKRVGKKHCQIVRTIRGVELHDCDSKNGTFVEGQHITSPVLLKSGQNITLGGSSTDDKNCTFTFETPKQDMVQPSATEVV